MAPERSGLVGVPVAASLLLWPALWNGYPIVFADSGTYFSQAVHHYAGWDRPIFYSLFIFALHWQVTLWPVIVAQAFLTSWILWLTWRRFAPCADIAWFLGVITTMSATSWLPWIVCEIMPDIFTPLLVLAIGILSCVHRELRRIERLILAGCIGLFIASQQSSLLLAVALIAICWAIEFIRRPDGPPTISVFRHSPLWLGAPLLVAIVAMCTVNLAAHGRFVISPFGNIFLLARVIYDGPGLAVLRQDCPASGWRLCPYVNSLPANSDEFLWRADSPLYSAGGPKLVAREASEVVDAALLRDPWQELQAAIGNAWEQMQRFASGDGLTPWPSEVSEWFRRDLPGFEFRYYTAARQQRGALSIPTHWRQMQHATALIGVVSCILLAITTREQQMRGLLLLILAALPISAFVTGAFSAPHDRYQSRIMWLPLFMAASALTARRHPAA